MPSVFDKELKLLRKWSKDPKKSKAFRDFRRKWRINGPIMFAHDVLKVDPETGNPLVLSEDQDEFLLDVGKRGIRLAIIVAGRGAGKTFALAVYVAWRIFTHEYWGISCMGGSSEQSAKIHKYISYWANTDPLRAFTVKCIKKKIVTYAFSYAIFLSCSGTAARGPHTKELIIDEQAAGEKAGKGEYIQASLFQVSTSSDIHIIKSSTAHFVHGDFLTTLNNAEKLGYKAYRWPLAKHISGKIDPYEIYEDINENNWLSNVPWTPDENIKIFRRNMANDKWLVEVLGGISRSSGLVFNPFDIDACVCDRCPKELGTSCHPYRENHCPIVQYHMQLEGVPQKKIPRSTKNALRSVRYRIEGIDWGQSSPCAWSVTGKMRNIVFVLESSEETGMTDDEKIDTADKMAKKWKLSIMRPDPREWSYNNELADRGYAVHELFGIEGGIEKKKYLFTLRRLVERHQLVIPCVFEDLIRSLKMVSYDTKGKVIKHDDHSFDSILYAVSYYGELMDTGEMRPEEEKRKIKPKEEEDTDIVKRIDKDTTVITDWEEWIKRRKKRKEELEDDDGDFPFGSGVDLWK